MLVDKVAPGAPTSTRGGRQTVAAEHFADGPVGAAMAQLAQLALDTPVPPARVPLGQLHDEVMQLAAEDASLAARPSPVSGPPAAEQLSGSREARYVPTVGPARTSLAFPTQARIPRVHGDFARFLPAPSPPAMGFFPSRREVEAYQRGIPMQRWPDGAHPAYASQHAPWFAVAFVRGPDGGPFPDLSGTALPRGLQGRAPSSPCVLQAMDRLHPEVLCSGGLLLLPHHRSYDLSCQTQRHSPIARSAVIRRALPCGCILAGLSPSPFHHCSFPTCNALRPRGARRPLTPSSSPPVTTFTPSGQGSALPLSTLCSGWPLLEAESHSPLDCSPPGQIRPGVAPGRRDFYSGAFAR